MPGTSAQVSPETTGVVSASLLLSYGLIVVVGSASTHLSTRLEVSALPLGSSGHDCLRSCNHSCPVLLEATHKSSSYLQLVGGYTRPFEGNTEELGGHNFTHNNLIILELLTSHVSASDKRPPKEFTHGRCQAFSWLRWG